MADVIYNIDEQISLAGKNPLPLHEECIKYKVHAPTMGGSRSFVERTRQGSKSSTSQISCCHWNQEANTK
eukprot:7348987-Ditylum_brightwellii.AAC.1